jgi:WG containing repeat
VHNRPYSDQLIFKYARQGVLAKLKRLKKWRSPLRGLLILGLIALTACVYIATPKPPETVNNSSSDRSTNILLPFREDEETGKYGYKDPQGKIVIPAKFTISFDEVIPLFQEELAPVSLDGGYGYINPKGETVIKGQFQEVKGFASGLAAVKLNDKWGYINKQGEMVIPPQFDSTESFSEGLAGVTLKDKYGYIDPTGNAVIPIEIIRPHFFYTPSPFTNNIAYVKTNNKDGLLVDGYITRSGNFISQSSVPKISPYRSRPKSNQEKPPICTLESIDSSIGFTGSGEEDREELLKDTNNQLLNLQYVEGELTFTVTNLNQNESKKGVFLELELYDQYNQPLLFHNPFRVIQGRDIDFTPPLKGGETRRIKIGWKFMLTNRIKKVIIKNCEWLNSEEDYFERYPELKDVVIP